MTPAGGAVAGAAPPPIPSRLPRRADGRATLSICIICQDSAAWLPRLLTQCPGVADEILLVDGGSTDSTASIAAAFPLARLLSRPWDGNHGRQRNFGWEHAGGDWILFLDTDELASPPLLKSYPAEEMRAYPVSLRVNSARNEGPELIEPA